MGQLSGSHSLEDLSPGMPSGPHLPAYGLPAHAGQPPLRSLGPFLLRLLSPHLAQDAGEVQGWWGPGARLPPFSSSFWGEGHARFSHISFQPFLGILNFALQSEGSKEWLPWQPFPCFCHQGTQDSV